MSQTPPNYRSLLPPLRPLLSPLPPDERVTKQYKVIWQWGYLATTYSWALSLILHPEQSSSYPIQTQRKSIINFIRCHGPCSGHIQGDHTSHTTVSNPVGGICVRINSHSNGTAAVPINTSGGTVWSETCCYDTRLSGHQQLNISCMERKMKNKEF